MADGQPSARSLSISVFAVMLATLIALAYRTSHHAWSWFFRAGDPVFYRIVARSPFGNDRGFRTIHEGFEASYRYGRIGFPLLGWIAAFGHASLVDATLASINLIAIAAIPALAILLMERYGAAPISGIAVLLAPGLLVLYDRAYAEPTLLAILLLAFLFDARGNRTAAIVTFAFAVLVKEIALLALIPFLWKAWRKRDWHSFRTWLIPVVPYAIWMVVVRVNVGEFPFAAKDPSRSGALTLPFVGMYDALRDHASNAGLVTALVLFTAVFGVAAAWWARRIPIAGAAAAFSLFALCTGPTTIAYLGETLRLLIIPHVLALLCVAQCVGSRATSSSARRDDELSAVRKTTSP
jgi:hypothetical protein